MKYYAVIDTNVLVSALLSKNNEAATVQVLERLLKGDIIPVYSKEIMLEYREVLNRKKFKFTKELINYLLTTIEHYGVQIQPNTPSEQLPNIHEVLDIKDLPFYEVVMEKRVDDTYLVTGNIKHFPKCTYVVTARQMLDILNTQDKCNLN